MLFETQSNFYLQLAVLGGCSAVYLALIAYGCWQDASMTVKYTDVDYWILYDAAKLLLDGRSPFERSTYRYSPLLTLPLIFDHLLRMKFIGKLIFCFVTILIGQMLLKMLIEKQRMTTKKALFVCLAGWTLNPLVMGISTRGSSEAIVMLPLLLFTWYITVQRRTLAAISLGFAIHLKLFPIIYLPSVLVFYGIFPWTLNRTRRISDCATSVLSTPLKSCATSSEKPTNLYLHLKRRHFTFTLLTLMTAGLLFMATIYAFGEKGIQESLLYHLTRRDHRHNFSSFFTLFHNNLNEDSSNLMNKALLFLPQVAMMLAVSLRFGRVDLPFACFLQTWLFVAFNRVITSQVQSQFG